MLDWTRVEVEGSSKHPRGTYSAATAHRIVRCRRSRNFEVKRMCSLANTRLGSLYHITSVGISTGQSGYRVRGYFTVIAFSANSIWLIRARYEPHQARLLTAGWSGSRGSIVFKQFAGLAWMRRELRSESMEADIALMMEGEVTSVCDRVTG